MSFSSKGLINRVSSFAILGYHFEADIVTENLEYDCAYAGAVHLVLLKLPGYII